MNSKRRLTLLLFIVLGFSTCKVAQNKTGTEIDDVAANPEVAAALRKFEGRGALTDTSEPTPAPQALTEFVYPDELTMELVLSEPQVSQPLFMNFDHRGRLWVVQYQQYPYPKGLKVMSIDEHLRIRFDKMPEAPPSGIKGADKITVYEDTDGDGTFDKATDAITGLNIATSVILGRKKIWVLNPPYLVAFPDNNEDGMPDGKPEVHLSGFGLEDTHAVANSLKWGPDGWLYGAQGSTTTAIINSAVSKNVAFKGQVIWRYHPESKVFEVFAEGGGNTFYVEIDDKGRIYSGDNGYSRGMYYKQGGYYPRNLDKHGPYTNPYTFGRLPNMPLEGDNKRFTHAWLKYQGGELPEKYTDKIIAINPLQSYLQLTRFEENGSNFKNVDEEIILRTNDRWFRPVDIKSGPDGALYLADWYDSRLSHVDARDTWHKSSGRIYRLKEKGKSSTIAGFDLSKNSNQELIELFAHPNRWFRQQALQVLADRKDRSIITDLQATLLKEKGQLALEILWAINLSGGFDDHTARMGLTHEDPYVRMWTVRLIGDSGNVSVPVEKILLTLSQNEDHPEVRSQLASSAKRLPVKTAINILTGLLQSDKDVSDPDIPLLIWWALESKISNNLKDVLSLFEERELWNNKIVRELLSKNLARRLILSGTVEEMEACAVLLETVPIKKDGGYIIAGIQEGLAGKQSKLPASLLSALKPFQQDFRKEVLSISLRQKEEWAIQEALKIIASDQTNDTEKSLLIEVLGEVKEQRAVEPLLNLLHTNSVKIKTTTLNALQYFSDDHISERIIKIYPKAFKNNNDLRSAAMSLLVSRPSWSKKFVAALKDGSPIQKEEVPDGVIQRLVLSADTEIVTAAAALWPSKAGSDSRNRLIRIEEIQQLLKKGEGNKENGKLLFATNCGSCHKLFKEGGDIGPDLTGYDRRNVSDMVMNTVDPSADIREGYVLYQIETKDGRSLAGKLAGQNGDTFIIQLLTGERLTIPNGQILKMEAQSTSLMPEGLLDTMKEQEIRDLFAYLTKLNQN